MATAGVRHAPDVRRLGAAAGGCVPHRAGGHGAWLARDYGLAELDAYQLVTQAGESPLANVCDTNYTSVSKIRKEWLPGGSVRRHSPGLREMAARTWASAASFLRRKQACGYRDATVDDADASRSSTSTGGSGATATSCPSDYLNGLSVEPAGGAVASRGCWSPVARGPACAHCGRTCACAGFAVCRGPSRDPGAGDDTGEVYAIYVEEEFAGTGLGTELLRSAVAWLAERGYARATLWVLEGNARARRFYEREGWTLDGAAKSEPREDFTMDEVRYADLAVIPRTEASSSSGPSDRREVVGDRRQVSPPSAEPKTSPDSAPKYSPSGILPVVPERLPQDRQVGVVLRQALSGRPRRAAVASSRTPEPGRPG